MFDVATCNTVLQVDVTFFCAMINLSQSAKCDFVNSAEGSKDTRQVRVLSSAISLIQPLDHQR